MSNKINSNSDGIKQNTKPPLIVLTGPTSVGKTELSIKIAKEMNGEIISADSIQVYKYMDIGSAKIKESEMCGIQHYLVDFLLPDEEFNVFQFQKYAKNAINTIYAKGKIPIIVGGTGFYIQSVLYDIDFTDESDQSKQTRLYYEKIAEEKGTDFLHKMLEEIDPKSAEMIHKNNTKRIIRALEYYKETGERISDHNQEQSQNESPYNFAYFVLNRDRTTLYQRIDQRVDIMIKEGLVNEVKNLLAMGYNKNLVSMQGLGYKETVDYLEGNLSLDEVIEIIKRETRHFAKRQLTWFRREKEVIFLQYEDFNNDINLIKNEIMNITRQKGIIQN